MKRRRFHKTLSSLGVSSLVGRTFFVGAASSANGCAENQVEEIEERRRVPEQPPEEPFLHGVASGDPLADALILWTRLTTNETRPRVRYQVASDAQFVNLVLQGEAETSAARDFTVKVDAAGLSPGQLYFYRFVFISTSGAEVISPSGRARTLRSEGPSIRLGVTTCGSLAHGYFHVYRCLAEEDDLDAVLHLGDYIYEYPSGLFGNLRPYEPPHEIVSLDDYRKRYAQYRRDPDVQAMHRQHAVIAVWDDHESANDAYRDGAQNHGPEEGSWRDRKDSALRAYFEWLPIREQTNNSIARRFRFGTLLDLFMLDTRLQGRDAPLPFDAPNLSSASRTILGAEQEENLRSWFETSSAKWCVVGQQVVVSPISLMLPSEDKWDDFPAARDRFLSLIEEFAPGNTVVLTGDFHFSMAAEVARDPYDRSSYDPSRGKPAIALEFMTPAASSGLLFLDAAERVEREFPRLCPHVKWSELRSRGYLVTTFTENDVHAQFTFVDGIEEADIYWRRTGPAFTAARKALNLKPTAVRRPRHAPQPAIETVEIETKAR